MDTGRAAPLMPSKGSTSARGYGHKHQQLRKQYQPLVASGKATCWRCGEPIHPNQPWDLGHDDNNRNHYRGPEHVTCNRATSGRRHQQPQQRRGALQFFNTNP